jgi:BarA-like signal transduction histidine kinase
MGWVWYRPGQEQLSQSVYNLLIKNVSISNSIWDKSSNSCDTTDTMHHKHSTENTLWITMLCRFCDVVHDIGRSASKTAPITSHILTNTSTTITTTSSTSSTSTGYDLYVQSLNIFLSNNAVMAPITATTTMNAIVL